MSDALREFSKIPILSSLSEQETFDLIRACKVHRIAAGDVLFRQGDNTRSMYIIESGAVDVLLERDGGRSELIAQFGALDVIGEMSLIDPGPRSATAQVTAESTLYEIRGDDFEGLLRADNPAAYKVVRSLARIVCRRIRSVNGRIEAELSGGPRPPVHTGAHERVRASGSSVAVPTVGTGGSPKVAGPGRPGSASRSTPAAAPGKPTASGTGVFRKMISKIWGTEDE
ncbi:MAG: cyclic nucleotide-binding domain-containing protein [Myxococcales bacterium]|nr:cyclic nucleotide-binding domain-containing protein [Myxococcales bacterium]